MKKIVYFLYFLPVIAFSQPELPAFTALTVNNGLSQNSAYEIVQDQQGFIWIGTGDGLNRYDGRNFRVFRPRKGDTTGRFLPGSIVNSKIVEDNEGKLWFNTNLGLVCFDKKREHFRLVQDAGPDNLGRASTMPVGISETGVLWGVISRRGLVSVDTRNFSTQFFPIVNMPVYHKTTFAWKGGAMWAVSKQGLMRIDPERGDCQLVLRGNFYGLSPGSGHTLFLGGKDEIHSFNTKDTLSARFRVAHSDKSIFWDKLTEAHNRLYAVSQDGDIAVLQQSQTGMKQHRLLLNDWNPTTALLIDASQNLWIGTDGQGVRKADFKPAKFHSFPPPGLQGDLMVKAVFLKSDDSLLIGTYRSGMIAYNRRTGVATKETTGKDQAPIYFIRRDSANRIWKNAGSRVGYIDETSLRFSASLELDPSGKEPTMPFTLFEYKKDHFLVGTNVGIRGIKVLPNGKIVHDKQQIANPNYTYVYDMARGADGSLYIGRMRGGFWRLLPGDPGFRVIDSGFVSKSVRHFYLGKDKQSVWMATDEGLALYDPDKRSFRLFGESDGMSNQYAYGILEENEGSFWFSTNKGINRARISYGNDSAITGLHFTPFTFADGLQSNEFNSGAFFRSPRGELFFGGVYGVNWFKPESVVDNIFAPRPLVVGIRINDHPIDSSTAANYLGALSLPYPKNNLSLEFAALEFTNPTTNKFLYKMEGLDHSWTDAGTNSVVRYAKMPPGSYIFKLRAANNDGLWSDEIYELKVTVIPPFWATWWFRTAALIMAALLTAGIVREVTQRRLKRQIEMLQHEQALNLERDRISREMHDEIGAGLTQITLLSESVKRHIDGPQGRKIEEIASTGRNLIRNISEIVWSMNRENGSLRSLLAYIREKLHQLLEHAEMIYTIDFPGDIPDAMLTSEQRRSLLLITTEIVHNAIRHSQATAISISASVRNHKLTICISDNGRGFDTTKNYSGAGLENMRMRAAAIGGSIYIESNAGKGSVFRTELLLTQNSHLVTIQ